MTKLLDNRYEVIRKLGAGGMAQVMLVKDTKFDREVAFKYFTDIDPPPEKIRRFRYECESIRNFNHHNLVKLLDYGMLSDGHPYYTMEYLPFPSLEEVMKKRGRLEPDYAANVVEQILEAFAQFHPLGLVHRDIKPANILVSEEGRVVLVDFGLAHDPNRTTLTKTGQFVGTPEYLAPEQFLEGETDERTDLYQLGLVVYKMLSAKRAFEGKSLHLYLANLQSGKYRPIRRFIPTISVAWESFIDKALSPAPNERFQNAKEVKEALKQVRSGDFDKDLAYRTVATKVVSEESSGASLQPAEKRNSSYLWVIGLLLLVLLPLWRFGSPEVKKESPLTVAMLRQPEMESLNVLLLKYEGPRDDELRLFFTSTNSEEKLLPTTTVSLKSGKALSRSVWALPLYFPSPPLSPFTLRILSEHKLDATFKVTPAQALDQLLEPVDALARRDLGKVLTDCQTTLLSFLRKKDTDEKELLAALLKQLDKGGLSEKEREELLRWLPKVLKTSVALNSPLANRLLPLRYLEAIACTSERQVAMPWGYIAPRLGVQCQQADPLHKQNDGFIGARLDLRQGVDKKVLKVAPALWFAKDYTRQQFSAMGGISMVEGMLPQNLIVAIKASATSATRKIDLAFPTGRKKSELQWYLDLRAWEWQPNIGLSLQINDDAPFLLLKGILDKREKSEQLVFNAQWFTIKLPRGYFVQSANQVKFEIFTLPSQQCKTALGVDTLRLRCQ